MNEQNAERHLDIVSDVVCPWCYIGKRRLGEALELLDDAPALSITWKPYELNPNMPPGGIDRKAYYEAKFRSERDAHELIANVTANAHHDGLEMNYDAIARVPNTITAHRLIAYAREHDAQNDTVDALFHAYFVAGLNIEDHNVLADIAASAGLDRASVVEYLGSDRNLKEVKAEAKAAHVAGIQGVPAFVYNGRFLFSGAQSPQTIALSIKRAIKKGL